jgi:hypothetical protein
MARNRFFAIALMGIGALLNSPAQAVTDPARCEDRAANCIGRCANPDSGTNNNKCMQYCDRHVISCLVRAHSSGRW